MRILHAIGFEDIGGIETLFRSYLQHDTGDCFEHHVLVLGDLRQPDFLATISKYACSMSYRKYWRGRRVPPWLRRRHLLRIFREVRPDVILVYCKLNDRKFWRTLEESGRNVIYYEHGAILEVDDRPEIAEHIRQTIGVLCTSHAARRMLELRLALQLDAAPVILNPLRADIAAEPYIPKVRQMEQPMRLGLIGRLMPEKGIPLAIRAMCSLKEARIPCSLHIAGAGRDLESLRTLVEQLCLADVIHFHGHIKDIGEFYRQTDVVLAPSVWETCPSVSLEAGYFGCPVICTATGGLPEIVINEKTGYCIPPILSSEAFTELGGNAKNQPTSLYDPVHDTLTSPKFTDPCAIAEKVRYLYEHPDVFNEMSAQAHSHITTSFRVDTFISTFQDTLLRMMESSGRLS